MKLPYIYSSMILASFLFISGCASTGSSGSSITSASLNAQRGAAGSVMSDAQARQYAKQQDLESREIDLAHKKKDLDQRDYNDTLATVDSTTSTVARVGSTLKYLDMLR